MNYRQYFMVLHLHVLLQDYLNKPKLIGKK